MANINSLFSAGISRYSSLESANNFFKSRGSDTSLQTAVDLAGAQSSARGLSNFNRSLNSASFESNRLSSYADQLSNIKTSYTNPVSGASESSGRTLSETEVNRIMSRIDKAVSAYNQAYTQGKGLNNADISSALGDVEVKGSLGTMGVTKTKDGTLNFDRDTFEKNMVAGETELSGVKSALKDLSSMSTSITKAVKGAQAAATETFSEMSEKVTTLNSSLNSSASGVSSILSNYFGMGTSINFLG